MTKTIELPPRIDVIGSKISACNSDTALNILDDLMTAGNGGYVCFANVHTAVTGYRDSGFQTITNNSILTVADGKPIYWVAKSSGTSDVGHVPGPDFMVEVLRRFPHRSHFFYGSTPEVLRALVESLVNRFPDLTVAGCYSPPFRPLTTCEREDIALRMRDSNADFVWVGLGAPKQEQWMADMRDSLNPAILFGVGAAFDFHAGKLKRAPILLRKLGLEWLYRLLQEPKRLWRRYLLFNLLFIYYLLRRGRGT